MDYEKESQIPWVDENLSSQSTVLPDIIEESNEIGTVVIFVISALLTISILFAVAIFIDCRQEKLHKLNQRLRPRKVLKIAKLPKFGGAQRQDKTPIIDQMQEQAGPSHII